MINVEKHKDPLHGVTLETILTRLLEKHGWEGLYGRIRINCFAKNPSIKSSLIFLRRTPWARAKVENLFCYLKLDERAGITAGAGNNSEKIVN